MANIIVRRINGAEHTITLKALATWLVDESRFGETLGKLVQHGHTTAEIHVRDASLGDLLETAVLTFVPSPEAADGPPAAPPDQAELPMRHINGHNVHVPTTEFEADVMILLRIPARVACRAASPEWAAKLIKDVCAGELEAPVGFQVQLDADYLESLMNNIDIAETSANPFRTIDVQDVITTRIRQRLLLEGRALSC